MFFTTDISLSLSCILITIILENQLTIIERNYSFKLHIQFYKIIMCNLQVGILVLNLTRNKTTLKVYLSNLTSVISIIHASMEV